LRKFNSAKKHLFRQRYTWQHMNQTLATDRSIPGKNSCDD